MLAASLGAVVNALLSRAAIAALLVPLFFLLFLATAAKATALRRCEEGASSACEERRRLLAHPHAGEEEADTAQDVSAPLPSPPEQHPAQDSARLRAAVACAASAVLVGAGAALRASCAPCGSALFWASLLAPAPVRPAPAGASRPRRAASAPADEQRMPLAQVIALLTAHTAAGVRAFLACKRGGTAPSRRRAQTDN
jgi:hypothetical protein